MLGEEQATGCGKTHTISGSNSQPGIIFLIMKDLFDRITAKSTDTDFSLTVSYLEIYNETVRDLLAPEKGEIPVRDHNGTATPVGLSTKEPTSAADVVEWITLGNTNRTVNATEANATSSRSHAVLRVTVSQKPRAGGLTDTVSSACLSVIDLAGSERASVTKNKGDRLIEGANINRSLLALGNCINALCDPKARAHVPYRDSKLTRLLKESLGGNCKTVMIVCVSPSSVHYDETHNTLQYANRAKEIKTKAIRNVTSLNRHVGSYCAQISEQKVEIDRLRAELLGAGGGQMERDADARAFKTSMVKLRSAWEGGKAGYGRGEAARSERDLVNTMVGTLRTWKTDVVDKWDGTTASDLATLTLARLTTNCDTLERKLTDESSLLRASLNDKRSTMVTYDTILRNEMALFEARHPNCLAQYVLATQLLEQELETSLAQARERGVREAFKCQALVGRAMSTARAEVGKVMAAAEVDDVGLSTLATTIDAANDTAFIALGRPTSSTVGTKRDAATRSPFEAQNPWQASTMDSGRKVPRAALAGPGSTPSSSSFPVPSSSYPIPPASVRKQSPRKSPKKPVSFRPTKPSPKKRKVQWRDETGDGWELADRRSPLTAVDGLGGTTNPFLHVTAVPSSPAVTTWTSTSTLTHGPSSTAAEMMAAKVKSRSTGTLLRKGTTATSRVLSTTTSSSVPFSFLIDDNSMLPPPLPRPFSDLSIPSTSMAPHSSGLFAPLVSSLPLSTSPPSRSPSTIGPQRSTRSSRRVSSSTPLLPTVAPPLQTTRMRASRAGPSQTFVAPGSIKKSPRKVPASKRTSPPLPSAGMGNLNFGMGVGGGVGSESAKRAVVRRESTMGAVKAARESLAGSLGTGKGGWR